MGRFAHLEVVLQEGIACFLQNWVRVGVLALFFFFRDSPEVTHANFADMYFCWSFKYWYTYLYFSMFREHQ